MLRLSIVDGFCPRPYDDTSLRGTPLGGTESAVVLLAETFAEVCRVEVLQHCRTTPRSSARGVAYRGAGDWRTAARRADSDIVIVVNSPKLLGVWARHAPAVVRILWRHNFLGNRHRRLGETLERLDARMVCVSGCHHRHTLEHLAGNGGRAEARCRTRIDWIPNPVRVHRSGGRAVDPDTLLFCSSPHKGLDEVLERFGSLRERLPSLRLLVANPGYLPDADVGDAGVVPLGALTRPALHARMSEALCIFYPQRRFAETFGLVAAEANALGTPVLAPSGLGALPEVIRGAGQLVDALDTDTLERTLRHWRAGGRPRVEAEPGFAPSAVRDRWCRLLGLPAAPRRARSLPPGKDTTRPAEELA